MGATLHYTNIVKQAFSVRDYLTQLHFDIDSTLHCAQVRKSMARIKYVINERRLAYTRAVAIHEQKRLEMLEESRMIRVMEEAEAAAEEAEAKSEAAGSDVRREPGTQPAETVAADILGTAVNSKSASSKS